jgi:putative ABC transport system permease protein
VSYVVASRTKDIGLRIALGAETRNVLGWAFLTGMRPVLIGLFCGLCGALVINRVMESALYGVAAIDPLSLSGVAVLLLATSALACYVPARRASRVDPTIAFRVE